MKRFVLLICLLVLSACDSDPQQLKQLRPNDVILAFGDSLTLGVGAEAKLSYPAQLSRLLARKVVNAGVSGEVSAEGARRLPDLLDRYEPDLLILCHGGNDLLRKLDRQALRDNLQRMYEAANQRGIAVVMIAVPQPNLLVNDADLYQQLAKELNIPLLEETLGDLMKEKEFKSDAIHLNAQGYRKLAESVADLLYRNGAL